MGKLDGKIALVTGGGQGIGRAISERLAADGATVAILELKAETGGAVATTINDSKGKALQTAGGQALFIKTDCTKTAEVAAAVDAVVMQHGQIDILVNNVGWAKDTLFIEEDEAYWDKVIALSMKAMLITSHTVLKDMVKRKGGRIINISSDAGKAGQLKGTVYAACKGGVITFTRSLARETARNQINVNCVCPGPTDTPLYEACIPDAIKQAFLQIIPLKRIGKPAEIAAAVAFFAGPDADYITGQTLSVSGGLTMQ